MKIKIVPKNKRARDRVKQHGENMILLKTGRFANRPAVFVKSEKRTWSGQQHWFGWFTDEEIELGSDPVR